MEHTTIASRIMRAASKRAKSLLGGTAQQSPVPTSRQARAQERKRGRAYLHLRPVRRYIVIAGPEYRRHVYGGAVRYEPVYIVSIRNQYLHFTKGPRDRLHSRRRVNQDEMLKLVAQGSRA